MLEVINEGPLAHHKANALPSRFGVFETQVMVASVRLVFLRQFTALD